ncbi:EAL domain-containing protein [Dehalobacter sp. 14DCB1]|uniref:EAL domain-containing protein n=1 Tax=Dehalobacter sp. 14DCB1 TaxID=2070227 RepID=UPI00249F3646|nr:EAL domain-containing protein [Dehalobacter sp. 14DCB1]
MDCQSESADCFLDNILSGRIKTEIAFQPIWDLQKMKVFGFEALARWENLRPDEVFLEAAQKHSVLELETLILAEICRIVKSIKEKTFINVHPSLPDPYSWKCLKGQNVVLEITESDKICFPSLNVLTDLGFTLALDDFGTGSATLESLCLVEPEYIKLDKSLIQSKNILSRDSLITAFVGHATRMNTKVIVEGIENREQLQAARINGSHYGQGYFLGKPEIIC